MNKADINNNHDGQMTAAQCIIAASLSQDLIAKIDAALIANANVDETKIAMLIARTMMEPSLRVPNLPDLFYRDRVKALVASGQLVAEGDLEQMRHSEVRLP